MTFRALHGLAPGYISILWAPYAPACTRGPWAKAPTLPEEIMSVESATSFKPIFMGRLFYMNFLWDVLLSPTVHNPWHFYYNLLVLEFVLFCLMSKSHWSHRCSVSTEHTGRYAQKMSAMSVQRKISDHVKVNRLQKDAEEFFHLWYCKSKHLMQQAKFDCCNWKIVLSSLFLWQMSLGLHGARQRRKDPLEHVSIHVWISSCSIVSLILCYIFESVFGAHLIPVPGENFQVVCVPVLFSLHYSKLLCSFCVTNEFSGVCVKLGWKIKWKKTSFLF